MLKKMMLVGIALLVLTGCSNNVADGGKLYDKWWVDTDLAEPQVDQPLWATQNTNERSGKDTWRCKECHGWDYRGAEGAYGSGSHFTGFVGVWDAREWSEDQLVAVLSGVPNPDHDFSTVLSDSDLRALARFLREGVVDLTPYINADKSVNGDAEHGRRLYGNGCVACHGQNGNEMNSDNSEHEAVDLVELSNDNPWEVFHKAMNGQPGVPEMSAGRILNWSVQDVIDVLAFLQS